MALDTHESRRRAQIDRMLDRAERVSRRLRSLMLVGVILAIIVPSVFIHEDSGPFLLKVVSAGLLAFLPGWLYLQFIRNKGRNLYDEFVLNLFRLRIDDEANLPAPPEHTTYYKPWKEAHGELDTQSKDNLYRSKFEAIYGRSSVSTLGMIADKGKRLERTEAFSPVIYATAIMALGWVLVLQPELLRLVQFRDVVPSGRPPLPVDALQFGFLGAYTFIVQDLVRRYYRDDLRTSGYIAAISRIVFSAVLIIALALVGGDWVGEQAPVYAFIIGFFPQIGLQVLKTAVAKPVQELIPSLRSDYPMSSIEGLNFWYEARLNEEGIEDMQHLTSANLVDLMLRTRAPIARLVDWLDQAFLHLHLPGDPEDVKDLRTNLRQLGIRTATELESSWRELGTDANFKRMLSAALSVDEKDGPIVVRSVLVTLNGESNYWHVREFRKIGWLSSDDGVASITVVVNGTRRAAIAETKADLKDDAKRIAAAPNQPEAHQSHSSTIHSNNPTEGSHNNVRAGGRIQPEEGDMNPEHQAKTAERTQAQEAAKRYQSSAAQREEIERLQREEHRRVVDTPEQIEARAGRLFETGQVPQEALMAAVPQDTQVERHRFLERIIAATNDLQAVNFLPRGARTARTVARISITRNGRMIPFGTGSLVSPRLLLTNNHVLPDVATAEQCTAEFNCELDVDMNNAMIAGYEVDPSRFFITNEHLDYTIVALKDGPDGRAPGDEFGWNQLIEQQGKIVTGEPVNIVGHPMGRAKEMAIRYNLLQNQVDDFLHYTTDTEPGNSGSPVFNDQWEVVALHHAGVPSTDDAGNWLKPDGSIWRPNDGDHTVHWIANEGARVSVVVRDLKKRQFSQSERQLFDEMGLDTKTVVDAPVAQPMPAPSMNGVPITAERQPSSPAKPGLKARGGPYGGDAQLVFLHGRRQEGLDPAALRRKWTGGLAKGLASTGLPPIDALDVWFPFYGDAFAHALGARETMPAFALDSQINAAEALAPREESTRELYEQLIEEAADQAGLPPSMADDVAESESFVAGLLSRVQKQLTWLANRSGLDEVLIAAIFRDVADYLDHSDIRDLVLDTVREHVPQSGRVVLVSHSLGTVVGMDLLSRLPDEVEVKHMVTAGSPLGMDGVYKRLIVGGPQKPERVSVWLNAWCAADAVAIGCPLNDAWGPFVTDVITRNPKERAHSIEEYLADEKVATTIGRALGAATG